MTANSDNSSSSDTDSNINSNNDIVSGSNHGNAVNLAGTSLTGHIRIYTPAPILEMLLVSNHHVVT